MYDCGEAGTLHSDFCPISSEIPVTDVELVERSEMCV